MNRHERRKTEALSRAQQIPQARADGRPQYYDIGGMDHVHCYHCSKAGLEARYRVGQAVMNDPANPPGGEPKGSMFTVCVHHLPDNAVIYNPRTNLCRNKAGDHTWEEAPRQEVKDALRNT